MLRILLALTLLSCLGNTGADADDRPPRSLDPRLKIELFAEQPQLNTPTGIDVDHQGRVWVIESNTHFRPDDYQGHPSDRLLIMQDTDGDGRADEVKIFADGFTHAMSVAVRPVWMERVEGPESRVQGPEERNHAQPSTINHQPEDTQHSTLNTQLFLATRREILLLEDTDGDDVCDKQTTLVRLETKGNYPHNGLAGIAFDALDWVYFGFGENLGEPYQLIGREPMSRQEPRAEGQGESPESKVQSPEQRNSDQPSTIDDQPSNDTQHSTLNSQHALSGGGEGGNIYRMRPDGTQLQHWATGFWNPHASCVDAFGRLFTVDNDPDSLPPCRLLHIIEGGDYGYRFRNGRKGLHPFTAWNGEIPGTLPMVAGTGEAPSGIVAYEHDAFPEEYLGNLIVTSWGDHRIDRFVLRPKGASFESIAEPMIQGGENFRPVGIALGPDGSLYLSDWVLRDYNLHGKGRVWRISALPKSAGPFSTDEDIRPLSIDRPSAEFSTIDSNSLASYLFSRQIPVRRLAARRMLLQTEGRRMLERIDQSSWTESRLYYEVSSALEFWEPEFICATWDWNSVVQRALDINEDWFEATNLASFIQVRNAETDDEWNDRWISLYRAKGAFQNLPRREDAPRIAKDDSLRLVVAVLARRMVPEFDDFARELLADPSARVRRIAVQWAAEEQMTELRPQVEAVLQSEPMTTDLFLATLAALEMLDGKNPKDFDQTPAGKYVLPLLTSDDTPDAVKVQALRLVDPADPGLTADLLKQLLASEDFNLRLETVRTLSMSPLDDATDLLIGVVQAVRPIEIFTEQPSDEELKRREQEYVLFCEALLGLANAANRGGAKDRATTALLKILPWGLAERMQAFRSLRTLSRQDESVRSSVLASVKQLTGNFPLDEVRQQTYLAVPSDSTAGNFYQQFWDARPSSDMEWKDRLLPSESEFDAEREEDAVLSGRRVFFHPNGPACFTCHTVNGRGGKIGPDLSTIGRSSTREKLIDSILEPSKEIAPQFTAWNMLDADGILHTGMLVHENQGKTTLGTTEGKLIELETINIETREPNGVSVMPDKLEDRMTVQEFRDLLAFLESLGEN